MQANFPKKYKKLFFNRKKFAFTVILLHFIPEAINGIKRGGPEKISVDVWKKDCYLERI